MSAPDSNGKAGSNVDKAIAKATGIIVFSGIAISLLKAINPYKNNNNKNTNSIQEYNTTTFSPQEQEPIIITNKQATQFTVASDNVSTVPSRSIIKIVKGDTLWGLSQKYGVSIDDIKEANGLTGNTIYTGKKLVIP